MKGWMSMEEGAAYAGIGIDTFRDWRALGLDVAKIKGIYRVKAEHIDEFIERFMVSKQAPDTDRSRAKAIVRDLHRKKVV